MLSVKYTAEQIAEMTKSKEINLITVDSKIYMNQPKMFLLMLK